MSLLWSLQAQALGSIGEYEESERLLEEVLRLKPNDAEVLHQLSNIYGLTGKHKEVEHYDTTWGMMYSLVATPEHLFAVT